MEYIAYYRVSTQKQGVSGLGLKAQKEAVENFLSPELIDKEFTEIETGTNKKYRPILNEALELCRKHNATLIIAKLDRLARNVSFVSSLIDSKVKFKAVDNPHATELTIHILSAVAQDEAKRISKRIKDALAIKRKELDLIGGKLGTNNLKAIDMLKGVQSIKDRAKNNPHNKRALAFVSGLTDRNLKLREIAELLNSNGFKTSTGKDFGTTQVIRLLQKIDS
jgi:DNA invertase Pin-like site-specific DNA recombinase|tara:strand:+ start:85 stop:753 length:669 start_codon:yes stop_codon:yes gene_type:complete